MKKFLIVLAILSIFLGFSGVASAIPWEWSDYKNFDPDVTVPPTLSYYHNLGNDGFDSDVDVVTSYKLTLNVYDDNIPDNRWGVDTWEWVSVWNPTPNLTTYFSMGSLDFGWSLGGLLDINHDGTLNVLVTSWHGDFVVDSSKLTAWGDAGASAPVPEPATMLLLGTGLFGLAGASRKKIFKKKWDH